MNPKAAAGSAVTAAPPGPRERRRLKMKESIRAAAFALFDLQGYERTTVEQIAAAADISPSTFFRYFATKDAVALDWGADLPFVDALDSQPADASLFDAVRGGIEAIAHTLSTSDLTATRQHYELVMRTPDLQAASFRNLNAMVQAIGEVVAARVQRHSDEIAVRMFAWSLAGAWIAAFHYWIAHPASDLRSALQEAGGHLEGAARMLSSSTKCP